jgi:2-polyprenyl-3-methyl-5-hydroxy-6-metoxy-1,4-benzoquinol methylase
VKGTSTEASSRGSPPSAAVTASASDDALRARAMASLGISSRAIYLMVAGILRRRRPRGGGRLRDVGCGTGSLLMFVRDLVDEYSGLDAVRYNEFPEAATFEQVDLDSPRWPVPDASADVTVAVETIEHLENPRAFVRELVRTTAPGGLIVVTTPNQLSLLSKLTLVVKDEFSAFRADCYPAHRTALLKVDLLRIAAENRLGDLQIDFTNQGRIPGTATHWPRLFRGQAFSDNVAISGFGSSAPTSATGIA